MIPKGKSIYNGELHDTTEDCSLPDFCIECKTGIDSLILCQFIDCPYRKLWVKMRRGFK